MSFLLMTLATAAAAIGIGLLGRCWSRERPHLVGKPQVVAAIALLLISVLVATLKEGDVGLLSEILVALLAVPAVTIIFAFVDDRRPT